MAFETLIVESPPFVALDKRINMHATREYGWIRVLVFDICKNNAGLFGAQARFSMPMRYGTMRQKRLGLLFRVLPKRDPKDWINAIVVRAFKYVFERFVLKQLVVRLKLLPGSIIVLIRRPGRYSMLFVSRLYKANSWAMKE